MRKIMVIHCTAAPDASVVQYKFVLCAMLLACQHCLLSDEMMVTLQQLHILFLLEAAEHIDIFSVNVCPNICNTAHGKVLPCLSL